jgi:hypothetical protein
MALFVISNVIEYILKEYMQFNQLHLEIDEIVIYHENWKIIDM